VAEAPEKKAPDASGAIERAKYRPGVLQAQREALPISGPSLVNGTQAAFFACIAALGAFFNLSLAANSCLTLSAMASVSTL
jgi:hypothetical protein